MASQKPVRGKQRPLLATLVTNKRAPCAFCRREVDDEVTYGKLYAIGEIQCHYFCVLLSCCLIQKGKDEEGLFGFLYDDILAEIERSKKHRCSYCSKGGATLGCAVSQCRKQFHLPCGRERNAMSLFYGNYKSYCRDHAPKQKIPDHIMAPAKLRMKLSKKLAKNKNLASLKELKDVDSTEGDGRPTESVCVICYEEVDGFPTLQTFWPPCCARDAWFHRTCLQRMALSAGMHYLKCPLCNDKDNFYKAVVEQGYYIPDRDAAWELEQNAFAEIYERPLSCNADDCLCPKGRDYDSDFGMWDMKICILCGTTGVHAHCMPTSCCTRFVCDTCTPAAPSDLDALVRNVEAVILNEQTQNTESTRRGPIMPSRMSLRRTKGRINYTNRPSTSQMEDNTTGSRRSLNLKPPMKPNTEPKYLDPKVLQDLENKLLSPLKMVDQGLHEKIKTMGVKNVKIDSQKVVDEMRKKLKRPKPLSEKRRIVNDILDSILDNTLKDNTKTKEPIKEWSSPKKLNHIEADSKNDNEEENSTYKENQGPALHAPITQQISPKKKFTLTFEEDTQDGFKNDSPSKSIADAIKFEEDSSHSTFELPPEFIANNLSDESVIFESPKLKTVDIQKNSSLEISENDEIVNIDVVNMKHTDNKDVFNNLALSPVKAQKCAFKFSPIDKETLQQNNLDIDFQSFKNQYLNEVDRAFKCEFAHKHVQNDCKPAKLQSVIDFAIEASMIKEKRKKKRKMHQDGVAEKKKELTLVYQDVGKKNIKLICENNKSLDLTVDTPKIKRKHKKHKKNRANIQVKIRWREERLKLKITQSKKAKKDPKDSTLKQYILNYPQQTPEVASILKPDHDVTPKKRKYVKTEKSPDNLVQTSIHNFFFTAKPNM
ncbi:uncharacterized protein LOC113234487 [Hyposmocoma kahamanoa]|uniref:uncharacterized protein LOC113234487 n=1 Tax=Hyposmocoma kahamanoa TaxID=1477025 RepID=UPI000E6D9CCE|nr:uncharacterized protein LOC113234487 [Hyposmocoma kahamanoa]